MHIFYVSKLSVEKKCYIKRIYIKNISSRNLFILSNIK